jgi:hypothetical protein
MKPQYIKIEVQKERNILVVTTQKDEAPRQQTTMRLRRGQTLAKMLPSIVTEALR